VSYKIILADDKEMLAVWTKEPVNLRQLALEIVTRDVGKEPHSPNTPPLSEQA
jgi:hypothetical protein